MQIKFYRTLSDKDHLTKDLQNELIINGTLKDSCDILNPVIEFENNAELFSKNYCIIPDFGRNYYITGMEIINKRLIVSLHVDVLATYKNDILSSRANIVRSSKGDRYIKDNRAIQTERIGWSSIDLGAAFNSGSAYILIKGVTG